MPVSGELLRQGAANLAKTHNHNFHEGTSVQRIYFIFMNHENP